MREEKINMVECDTVIEQISVFLENRPGSLAEVARYIADHNINLRALSLAETRDFGTARLIVADTDACVRVLSEGGYHFTVSDVIAIEVADRPGGMADVLEILAREYLSVEYAYAMVASRKGCAIVVIRIDDPLRACTILQHHGVKLLIKKNVAAL